MKLNINLEGLVLPVSQQLVDVLNSFTNTTVQSEHTLLGVSITFKDSSYSTDTGGYHPVEIGVAYCEGQWQLEYITDFAFVGGPYPELAKEVDFNFLDDALYMMFIKPMPLNHPDTKDFYLSWESNFISYVEMECYDKVEVTQIT